MDLEVDLGFKVKFTERFRLYGIDAPETYGVSKESAEYKAGIAATTRLSEILFVGRVVTIITHKDTKDKYGRYLVNILDTNGISVSSRLLDEGLVTAYPS